ncbi:MULTISPECIES: hypothetical protein [Amycolatopsis]|uniref:Uncharacterized protein n=1 Tax=Amycolatopsis albidoflavus TaxID=102226 RepID=A0ABW5I7I9_9PSEU
MWPWRVARNRSKPPAVVLVRHKVGPVLVIGPPSGPSPAARKMATELVADPHRATVILDLAATNNVGVEAAVVNALRGLGPVRLVSAGPGKGPLPPAQWIAEQVSAEVVTPGGWPRISSGTAFTSAGWWRFRPGRAPELSGARFPAPAWEAQLDLSSVEVPDGLRLDPIPAGFWLGASDDKPIAELDALACRTEAMLVAVGTPGGPALPEADIAQVISGLSACAREFLRLVPLGAHCGVPAALADRLSFRVESYTGLPHFGANGADVVVPREEGTPAWHPCAQQLLHLPGTAAPIVLAARPPIRGLAEVAPSVYRLGDRLLVEVVASGLWLYEGDAPPRAGAPRARPFDPAGPRLTVGPAGTADTPGLRAGVAELLDRLPPEDRDVLSVHAPCRPALTAPRQQAALETDAPTRELRSAARERITGPDKLEILDQMPCSTPAERAALRSLLGSRYAAAAESMRRLLALNPALRGNDADAAIDDLLAVRRHLATVEADWPDPKDSVARCVLSGLAHLPLHCGLALHSGWLDDDAYRFAEPGAVLCGRYLLSATAAPGAELPGNVEYLIWSRTGRQVSDVEVGDRTDRVVFGQDAVFRVIEVRPGASRAQVLLLQTGDRTQADKETDKAVRARLRRIAADRDSRPMNKRVPLLTKPQHAWIRDGLSAA